MVLSRKQVLVLAGVILVLAAVSVGYQYYGRWHGNRLQPQGQGVPQTQGSAIPPYQGKSILDPPLQGLLLPLDTVVKKKTTSPGGNWAVIFETGADWNTLSDPVSSYFQSQDYELDLDLDENAQVFGRRWNSPDRRFFVTLVGTTPINGVPKNPGEVSNVHRYMIGVGFESSLAPKQPFPEEAKP